MLKEMFIPVKDWTKFVSGAKMVHVAHVASGVGAAVAAVGWVLAIAGENVMWKDNIPATDEEVGRWGEALKTEFPDPETESDG